MYTIGVDIGGMSVKVGLVDENGKIIKKNVLKTASTPATVAKNTAQQIRELLSEFNLCEDNIDGIGIGIPGTVTPEEGKVDFADNIGWRNVYFSDELKKFINSEVRICNDANVAALAENIYGCAKNYKNSVMFTLGTGVGGGVIIENKLFEGGSAKGTELGHVPLILGGHKCACGKKGCIECYVSASALIRQTKNVMLKNNDSKMWEFVGGDIEKTDGRTAFECSKTGDKAAIKVVKKYIYYLSESIMGMLNVFRPEAFILGGGISAQGKYLTDMVVDYCEKHNYGYAGSPKTDILTATLGNDAGIIGAAALFRQ